MDIFDIVLYVACGVVGGLIVLALRARDEERHARERKPAPEAWIIDRAGYWWLPVDCGGYIPVRPVPQGPRRRLDPDIPPIPVAREWIDREIGIKDTYDQSELRRWIGEATSY